MKRHELSPQRESHSTMRFAAIVKTGWVIDRDTKSGSEANGKEL